VPGLAGCSALSYASSYGLSTDTVSQGIVQGDEFTDYVTITINPATDAFIVLQYWKMREAAYSNLSKLARKHMAVCVSSTQSECSFSLARLLVLHLRNRLRPGLFHICMLLWSMRGLLGAENM
jgi:hAT family C-terminal dimerisation region